MPVPSLFWARVRGALIWVLYGLFLALALYTSYGGALSDGRESWEADGFHFQAESTFLGSHAEASDSVDRSGWVMVDVFDCRFSWLADLVVRDLLAEEGRSPEPMGCLLYTSPGLWRDAAAGGCSGCENFGMRMYRRTRFSCHFRISCSGAVNMKEDRINIA